MLHNGRQEHEEKRLKNNQQEVKVFVCDISKKVSVGELTFYLIKRTTGPTLWVEEVKRKKCVIFSSKHVQTFAHRSEKHTEDEKGLFSSSSWASLAWRKKTSCSVLGKQERSSTKKRDKNNIVTIINSLFTKKEKN